ncbi:hypothetical protein CPB86DRAFT_808407 [Serendipita vermifera]|nr:hypothetical protein CPB86DRAFT_808407 [Serendipita vermifera]
MAYQQIQQLQQQQQQQAFGDGQQYASSNLDSITLGQLRSALPTPQKPKQTYYDFHYEDEDNLFEEINEFYAFIEVEQLAENLRVWQGSFDGDWTKAPYAKRKACIVNLLEDLEHKDSLVRYNATRRLLYLLQGSFAESTGPEHQMHWIIENAKTVRDAQGITIIVDALKLLSVKHEQLATISDADLARINAAPHMRQSWLDEVLAEISMCLGILYPIIEVFRSDDEFAEELSNLYSFFLPVTWWRSRDHRLAVPWRLIALAFIGVVIQAHSAGLPSTKLAEALTPLPVRHHYVHPDANNNAGANPHNPNGPNSDDPTASNAGGGGMMAGGTPAPSPSPSPKPKKQQYQTDQTKPFVFPFSPAAYVSNRLVPYAIEEADQLYNRHMHVSLALFQIWRTREDFILDESGLDVMPGDKEDDLKMKRWSVVSIKKRKASATAATSFPGDGDDSFGNEDGDDDEEETVTWPDSKILEEAIERTEKDLKKLDSEIAKLGEENVPAAKKAERKRLKERRGDLMRIQRAETIYAATLPFLSGYVVVLLKFLIAINNITSAQANHSQQQSGFFPNQPIEPPQPQMNHSPEEIDALRHREIMIKGLSAFLLLLLKWFKRSHIMKYHHLAFTLLSAGTHVHILRLLTYTEVSTYVITKNEVPERAFFRYCYDAFSPNAVQVPATEFPIFMPRQATRITTMPNGAKGDEEVEMITDFSWRNFFAIINAIKIMHKITKSNPTRIQQLVHHKASAILKRMMRISHPVLQLQLLKLVKSQVPYSGRKWKQLNMKLITAIYLNCRSDLRDEWLTTVEVEESKDSPSNVETFLRRLVAFYDYKRYGHVPPKVNSDQHQRSASLSIADPAMSPEIQIPHPIASPAAADVFPPLRSQAADPSIFMPYPSEDIAFEEEYEEYLFDLHHSSAPPDMVTTDRAPSWTELPNDQPLGEGISDSESVASIGDDLTVDNTGPDGKTVLREDTEVGKNDWAHMSPKTLNALPKSPAKSPAGGGGRRSSSGTGLRPVLPFDLDDPEAGSAVDDDDEAPEMGPMPIERQTPFAEQDSGKGVDEVEYLYGE